MKRALFALVGVILLLTSAPSFAGVCGDVNNSGTVNLSDVSVIINYLYRGGPAPVCDPEFTTICGDFDASGALNLLDVSYLTNYLYRGGPAPVCVTVTDIDGNVYKGVKIGNQWWMAENLKVTHYRNGDPIPNITGDSAWYNHFAGAYCNYNNDIANVAIYGRLYNRYAISDSRNIAPTGWHVSTDAEWQTMINYLGGDSVAGGKLMEAGTEHWGVNEGGTNESGFTALPGGFRASYGGFVEMRFMALFWASMLDYPYASSYYLDCQSIEIFRNINFSYHQGHSIRCVRD
jgi:uncharacterized protein (TIGR02145 family)